MALETVVFPEDPFLYCNTYSASRDLCTYPLSISTASLHSEQAGIYGDYINNFWVYPNSSSPETASSEAMYLHQHAKQHLMHQTEVAAEQRGGNEASGRRKRRRVKNVKNKEEIENQRMTHIAVERNRRKQMNEYLSVLRSLMPPSYSQRVSLWVSIRRLPTSPLSHIIKF